MNLGNLDRRIAIEVATITNVYGEAVTTWTTFASVWANYRPLRGKELIAAQQVDAQIEASFRVRWIDGLTPAHRISFDGEIWDIMATPELGRREGIDIMAKVHRL